MTPERIQTTYADLLDGDASEPTTLGLLAGLDTLYSAPDPPADLATAFSRLLATRENGNASTTQRHAAIPDATPTLPASGDHATPPLPQQSGWLRQGLSFAGAALAIALVAAVLVAVFRGRVVATSSR